MDIKKLMPVFQAFFSFLMALINNVTGNKMSDDLKKAIEGIETAAEGLAE